VILIAVARHQFCCRGAFISGIMVWNHIGWVAGENFLEITPQATVPLLPLLAILNASPMEMAIRANAHVYGGGVYNLSPGRMGEVPVIDVRRLSAAVLQRLEGAYRQFILTQGKDALRSMLQSRQHWLTGGLSPRYALARTYASPSDGARADACRHRRGPGLAGGVTAIVIRDDGTGPNLILRKESYAAAWLGTQSSLRAERHFCAVLADG
jgi:hypothetical protein